MGADGRLCAFLRKGRFVEGGGGGNGVHPGKYQDFLTNSVQPAEINTFCCKITQNALQ